MANVPVWAISTRTAALLAFASDSDIPPAGPDGRYLLCDGSLYDGRTDPDYAMLFSKIGTRYGGTGVSSFAVPVGSGGVSLTPSGIVGYPSDADQYLAGDGTWQKGMRLLASSHLSAPAASFDFTGIDTSYENYRVVLRLRSDAAATTDEINMQVAGNTGTNYWSTYGGIRAAGTVFGFGFSGTAFWKVGITQGGTAGSQDFSMCIVDISCSPVAEYIPFLAHGANMEANLPTTSQMYTTLASGIMQASFTAITEIKVFPTTGSNWVKDSLAAVYGIPS